MPVPHAARVEQIGGERGMARFDRVALDVGIAEQPLFFGLVVAVRQADDDDMDMRLPSRLAAPAECAVREGDFEPVAVEQDRPQLCDLFALRDRVGRDERNADALVRAPP